MRKPPVVCRQSWCGDDDTGTSRPRKGTFALTCYFTFFWPWVTSHLVNLLCTAFVNRALIESGYEARTEKELPVLVRYVTKQAYEAAVGRPLPKAKFLDIILYSRKQLIAEAANMSQPAPTYSNEWAVISVKPQVGSCVVGQ